MKDSKYQVVIYDKVKESKQNILIEATAGSGKTTTLVKSLDLVPRFKKTLFCAFNKSIAEELKTRVPEHIHVYTLHALGFSIIRRNKMANIKLNEWKYFRIFKEVADKEEPENALKFTYNLKKIYELYRMTLCFPSVEKIIEMCIRFDIDIEGKEPQAFIKTLPELEKMNRRKGKDFSIDYTDMVYLPVSLGFVKPDYDIIFVDEAQDLNKAQQELLFKLIKPTGKIIACGDPYQSIYGFAGSDINSFDRFKDRNNTITLPLSISYRCATNIIEEAKTVNEVIEPYENNEPGIVRSGSYEDIQEGDFVLCRNVQPLVELYFMLILSKKKAYVKGKDIAESIQMIVDKLIMHMQKERKPLHEYKEALEEELREIERKLSEQGVQNPKMHNKYLNFKEKKNIIEMLANKTGDIKSLKEILDHVFDEPEAHKQTNEQFNSSRIMLSTIHKSKGLETNRVFILRKELIPSKYAKQPWQFIQEQNLKFVMITRAKKELVYINNF